MKDNDTPTPRGVELLPRMFVCHALGADGEMKEISFELNLMPATSQGWVELAQAIELRHGTKVPVLTLALAVFGSISVVELWGKAVQGNATTN